MVNLTLPDQLAHQLAEVAEEENRPLADVLADMLALYQTQTVAVVADDYDPIEDIFGVFDDDITDLSSTVRQTIQARFRKQNGDTH